MLQARNSLETEPTPVKKTGSLGAQPVAIESPTESLNVFVRVRPFNSKEKAEANDELKPAIVLNSSNSLMVSLPESSSTLRNQRDKNTPADGRGTVSYTFDNVLGPNSTQEDVFSVVGSPFVDRLVAGKSSLLLAYGISGSGKTHVRFLHALLLCSFLLLYCLFLLVIRQFWEKHQHVVWFLNHCTIYLHATIGSRSIDSLCQSLSCTADNQRICFVNPIAVIPSQLTTMKSLVNFRSCKMRMETFPSRISCNSSILTLPMLAMQSLAAANLDRHHRLR